MSKSKRFFNEWSRVDRRGIRQGSLGKKRPLLPGLTGSELLEPRLMLSALPIDAQFLVNETVSLEESTPAVAIVETSGDMVVAWTSYEQPGFDTSGLGVYAQQFLADGTANGAPILVNALQTAGDQFAPDVAVNAAGEFVVVWQGLDLDGFGIFGQRFDSSGNTIGSQLQLNTTTLGEQSQPAVAMDNAGNFVVAWQSDGQDGSGLGVFARRFDSTGNPLEAEELQVNADSLGIQAAPAVAMARGNGNFVITWEGEVVSDHSSFEIFAHVYDGNGNTIHGEFQVNATAAREQVNADVAMDFDGDMVVTWTTEGLPGSGSDIFAQRLDAAGNAVGGEFQVNIATLQGQLNSVATMDADGDFLIAWQSSHQDEFSWGIFGRAYASSGLPLSTDLLVNTYVEEPQTSPALASNSAGQTVAIWLGLDVNHANAVHAQRYQLPGTEFAAVGGEIVLANYLGLEDAPAAAAVNANRDFFVVWQSYGDDGSGLSILGRRFNAVGAPLGDAFVINTTSAGNQLNPSIAMDGAGNAIVVWESADQDGDGHGIFAQRYDAAGNAVGAEFQVNSTVLGSQTQPAVAMRSTTGDFTVVWQSPDVDGQGIFAQRFAASGTPIGSEFQVNQQTALAQVTPEIAMNAAGQFAVVWVSDHRAIFDLENDSEKSIFVQWFDSNGSSVGEEQLVHAINRDYQAQEYPDVALDGSGNMSVVWQSIAQDGSAWGVFGRQFLADKTPVQAVEFQINQTTSENQRHPTVAADPFGNFTVSWQSDLQDQSATAIVSRQYLSNGSPATDEMLVNTWTLGPQILPITAMTSAGDFGIFWNGQGTGRTEGIHGRIFEEGFVPPAPHMTVTPIGDQFLVSAASGLEQSFPAVAVRETTGNYIAAWTSFEQVGGDESGLGVYAQVFTAEGIPVIDAFLVNALYTSDDQAHPAVAVDAAGNFVVVWQSLQQDGSGWGIYAHRFAADGSPIGGPFAVNTVTVGDQALPTVAMDNAGNFVIAWQGPDDDGSGVYARRYDASGAALETQEFRVNPTMTGNQTAPTATRARDDGRYLIGWQSEEVGLEGEIDVNILASLYDAGGNLLSQEFVVNTITEKDQVGPRAAMGPFGEFVVAWTSEGQVGSGADVYARRFDANGTGLGDDFRVNLTTSQGQQYPSVAIDADGDFIVTWQSSHQDGFSWGIFGKVYDLTGAIVLDEFQVNTNVQGPQTNPAVHANSQGTAIVTWLGLDASHQSAVHAQRYQLPQGTQEFAVGTEGEVILNNYAALEEAPAATAVDAAGNFVVTWQSYGEDGSGLGVFARRFDAAGAPLGDVFQVNTTILGNQGQPAVASDGAGNFIIVWQAIDQDGDGYGIFTQRYAVGGVPLGGEFQVNASNSGQQEKPDIALNSTDGSALIVWQGPDADGLGIFGQRYDALGNTVGGEFAVNLFTDLDQVSPTVSMNANGEAVVGWVSDHRAVFDPNDSEKSIFVQWYNASGVYVGEEVLVHSVDAAFDSQELPDVALDAAGNFVVAWQSVNQDGNTWGVFARQFLRDKSAVQPIEFQVNQTVMAPQRQASVVVDAVGNFVVAWQSHAQDSSGPGVFARAYDACAVPQTDEFLIPTADQGPQTSPVMALAPNGKLGIFWTGHGTDRIEGVHGRIYDVAVGPVPTWVLQGTPGDDVILVDMSGDRFVVTINGMTRTLDPCRAASLFIHGLGGYDQIRVAGGTQDETAVLQVGALTISNAALALQADSVENIVVTAGTGDDHAYLQDSTGNDVFRGRPTFSAMIGDGFFNRVDGFDRTVGNATQGDLGDVGDRAYLMDSAGNDIFRGNPTFSVLTGDGFFNRANGFDGVFGYAKAGNAGQPGDQAFLNDSAGNDIFRGRSTFSIMTGDQYFYRVNGFGRVVANATAGDAGGLGDQAFLQDSAGNDTFYSRPSFSELSGVGFSNRANGFDRVSAFAVEGDAGGSGDQASMYDSPNNDLFYGRADVGQLSGAGFLNWSSGFDSIVADGTAGGVDTLDVDALVYSLTPIGWEVIV